MYLLPHALIFVLIFSLYSIVSGNFSNLLVFIPLVTLLSICFILDKVFKCSPENIEKFALGTKCLINPIAGIATIALKIGQSLNTFEISQSSKEKKEKPILDDFLLRIDSCNKQNISSFGRNLYHEIKYAGLSSKNRNIVWEEYRKKKNTLYNVK